VFCSTGASCFYRWHSASREGATRLAARGLRALRMKRAAIMTHFCDPRTRFRSRRSTLLRTFSNFRGSGAGSGNRTRIASLEGWCFTTKLYPPAHAANATGVGLASTSGLNCAGRFSRLQRGVTAILSMRRVPPMRAATSRRAGAFPKASSGASEVASASTA
jgi:hypothetical protein